MIREPSFVTLENVAVRPEAHRHIEFGFEWHLQGVPVNQVDRRRYVLPLAGWARALSSARRYRRRFDSGRPASRYGERLLRTLR